MGWRWSQTTIYLEEIGFVEPIALCNSMTVYQFKPDFEGNAMGLLCSVELIFQPLLESFLCPGWMGVFYKLPLRYSFCFSLSSLVGLACYFAGKLPEETLAFSAETCWHLEMRLSSGSWGKFKPQSYSFLVLCQLFSLSKHQFLNLANGNNNTRTYYIGSF